MCLLCKISTQWLLILAFATFTVLLTHPGPSNKAHHLSGQETEQCPCLSRTLLLQKPSNTPPPHTHHVNTSRNWHLAATLRLTSLVLWFELLTIWIELWPWGVISTDTWMHMYMYIMYAHAWTCMHTHAELFKSAHAESTFWPHIVKMSTQTWLQHVLISKNLSQMTYVRQIFSALYMHYTWTCMHAHTHKCTHIIKHTHMHTTCTRYMHLRTFHVNGIFDVSYRRGLLQLHTYMHNTSYWSCTAVV